MAFTKIESQGHFGILQLETTAHQQFLKNILLSKENSNDLMKNWEALWYLIDDYEALDEPSKKMMSMVIFKLNQSFQKEEWLKVTKNNPGYLAGLPKHAWTKNQLIYKDYSSLSDLLNDHFIPHLPILGIAGMIQLKGFTNYRTIPTIAIVIESSVQIKAIEIVKIIGWELQVQSEDKLKFSHASKHSFLHVHLLDKNDFNRLIHNKLFLKNEFNTYIPSVKDQITFLNKEIKDISTWRSHAYVYYELLIHALNEFQQKIDHEPIIKLSSTIKVQKIPAFHLKFSKDFIIANYFRIKSFQNNANFIFRCKLIVHFLSAFCKELCIDKWKKENEKITFIPFAKP